VADSNDASKAKGRGRLTAHDPLPSQPRPDRNLSVRQTIKRIFQEAAATNQPPLLPPEVQAAADKAVLGICELLGLLFGLPFGEDLYKGEPISSLHIVYLIVGILFAGTGPMWPVIRTLRWVSPTAIASISRAAFDARIWIMALLILFLYGVGPELYRRATRNSRVETPQVVFLPTNLKLQFDAEGGATEIEANNVKWKTANLETITNFNVTGVAPICPLNSQQLTASGLLGTSTITCSKISKQWLFILSFEKPIKQKKVRLKTFGAQIPDWENEGTTANSSVVWVKGELKNLVLDIELVE
jgi:hypothetical protein